jgi:SAM-dependent methyltransferase
MNGYWWKFWADYGPAEASSDGDLLRQVAHTVNKQPICRELVVCMLDQIEEKLGLAPTDHLLEFCCGNGFFSYELASKVAWLTGIDFVERNIRIARSQRFRANTTYMVGDATAPLRGLFAGSCTPGKFLMHNSLAYFSQDQFSTILEHVLELRGADRIAFLLTGVPNDSLKWNFYNTPNRVARYRENEKQGSQINDGVGRWWRVEEIQEICAGHNLQVEVANTPEKLSCYRMDVLISSSPKSALGDP